MSTQVQRNDAGQLTGVDLDTFLKTPLRGLRENSQLFRSDLIYSAAHEACGERNCAAHQLSTALGYDYTRLWDDFRSLVQAQSLPGECD